MRISLFIITAVLFTVVGWAQTNASSFYSSQGIGETTFFGSSKYQSLGGASVALYDSTTANIYNPASYATLAKGLPLFSLGAAYQRSTFSLNGAQANGSFANLTHMAIVVPFANRFGLGFGLKPFSRVGYDVNDSEIVSGQSDTTFYQYTGRGGIQQFFGGLSIKVLDKRKHTLSIGGNTNFYFGTIANTRRAYAKVYTSQRVVEKGFLVENFASHRDIALDFGLMYNYRPSKEHKLTFGATWKQQSGIVTKNTQRAIFYNDFYAPTTSFSYDTITETLDAAGLVISPQAYKVGLTYEFTPVDDSLRTRNLKPSYLFTGEYDLQSWSAYSKRVGNVNDTVKLGNASSFRLGFQFTPHKKATDRSTYIKYYHKMSYRVGYHTSTLPNIVNGGQLKDFGISFGIGLPIVINRAISSVNIGVNYGKRGNDNINTIQEDYWGINFGVHLSPGYDRWFRKYKYD